MDGNIRSGNSRRIIGPANKSGDEGWYETPSHPAFGELSCGGFREAVGIWSHEQKAPVNPSAIKMSGAGCASAGACRLLKRFECGGIADPSRKIITQLHTTL